MLLLVSFVMSLLLPAEPLADLPKQRLFKHAAPHHRITALFGGLQSGKTIASADTAFYLLYHCKLTIGKQVSGFHPEVWFVSKSYNLVDAAWDTYKARNPETVIPDHECRRYGLIRGGQRTHWLYPNIPGGMAIKVRCRTARDPEDLRATPNVILVVCDEIAHWKKTAWDNLQGRGIVTPTKYLITTTPKGRNWLYHDIYKPAMRAQDPDKSIAVFQCSSFENPWADASWLNRLVKRFGPEYAQQEIFAQFTDQIGYVYADFDRDVHMVKPPSEDPKFYKRVVAGVDPGTSDPYAVGIWGRTWDTEKDPGKWYQLEEFYRTGGSSTHWLDRFVDMQKRWKCQRWYVDKRKPSDILDLQRGDLPAVPNVDIHAENDRHTIPPMVSVVRELLRAGRLFIGYDDEFTADEFENYHYPEESEEREKNTNDIPVDWMNHAMDQMRYAICSEEEVRQGPMQYKPQPGKDGLRPAYKEPRQPGKAYTMPTIYDSLAQQDEKFEEGQP